MANILVYIELRGGLPTEASLFALGEARRVSSTVGATVFAILTVDPVPPDALDALAEMVGRGGADKILLCQAPGMGRAPLDAWHGHALAAAAERVPPTMIFLPAGGVAAELGPPLAARLGAAFAPGSDVDVVIEAGPSGASYARVRLRRWRAAGDGYRVTDAVEIERPVVATLGRGRPRPGSGEGDIELVMVPCAVPADPAVVELDSEVDPEAAVEQAYALVLLPDGAAVPPPRGDVVAVPASTLTRGAAVAARPAVVLGTSLAPVLGTPRTVRAVEVRRLEDVSQVAGDVVLLDDAEPDWAAVVEALARQDGTSEAS